MWKGRIKHVVWLSLDDTIKYNEIARKVNTAPNVIQSKILSKALEEICDGCGLPKLICSCEFIMCRWCKKHYRKGLGFDQRFCSTECATEWWNNP
jgi:hypothetical protein